MKLERKAANVNVNHQKGKQLTGRVEGTKEIEQRLYDINLQVLSLSDSYLRYLLGCKICFRAKVIMGLGGTLAPRIHSCY